MLHFFSLWGTVSQEILIQTLEELVWVRWPAQWFLTLIRAGRFSDELKDMLSQALMQAIGEVKDKKVKKTLLKAQSSLELLRQQEEQEREEELEDLLELESMFDDL